MTRYRGHSSSSFPLPATRRLTRPRGASMTIRNPEHMLAGGFTGEVYLVNPHHDSIGGRRCYRDVASLPAAPELALIATKPEAVPALIGDLGKKGTRAVVVVTAGFSPALKQAMLDQAKPYCLRII